LLVDESLVDQRLDGRQHALECVLPGLPLRVDDVGCQHQASRMVRVWRYLMRRQCITRRSAPASGAYFLVFDRRSIRPSMAPITERTSHDIRTLTVARPQRPRAAVTPIAAVIQMPAAVVRPVISCSSRPFRMAPAPMKPMP